MITEKAVNQFSWGIRINQAWLKSSILPQIMKNRLERYHDDAINYYTPDETKRVNPEEKEGDGS